MNTAFIYKGFALREHQGQVLSVHHYTDSPHSPQGFLPLCWVMWVFGEFPNLQSQKPPLHAGLPLEPHRIRMLFIPHGALGLRTQPQIPPFFFFCSCHIPRSHRTTQTTELGGPLTPKVRLWTWLKWPHQSHLGALEKSQRDQISRGKPRSLCFFKSYQVIPARS